jgi:hypothetical protein
MYTPSSVLGVGVGAGAASASLAATGINIVWLVLASFALLGAGLAVMRIVPRTEG